MLLKVGALQYRYSSTYSRNSYLLQSYEYAAVPVQLYTDRGPEPRAVEGTVDPPGSDPGRGNLAIEFTAMGEERGH